MATDREKPLVGVGGRTTVDRVLDAMVTAERVGTVHAVVSPNAPATDARVSERTATTDDLRVIRTPGDGYVADLTTALDRVDEPVVSAAADLPLLTGSLVDHLLRESDGSTTVVVPARLKRTLGASVDERPYRARVGEATGDETEPLDEPERHGLTATDASAAWVPSGLNVVDHDEDEPLRSWDARLAVNLNYQSDVQVADRLASGLSDGREGDE